MVASILCSLFVQGNAMAKPKEKLFKVPGIRNDELGIAYMQKTETTDCAFIRRGTQGENYKYRLFTYTFNGKKLKKNKMTVEEKNSKKIQKMISEKLDFSIRDSCMDNDMKYVYASANQRGKVVLYRLSMKGGDVKKINLSKQVGKLGRDSSSPNRVKCFAISPNHIGLRIEDYRKGKEISDEPYYRVCILDTKTNKIIKKNQCNFLVEGMNSKYIYGFEKYGKGRLCYRKQKKGAKVIKVDIDNPENEIRSKEDVEAGIDLPARENCSRIAYAGKKLYYTTRTGLYCYNIVTKKNRCVLKSSRSKYLKKYENGYIAGITVSKKKEIFLLCATGWRSGYKLLKVKDSK